MNANELNKTKFEQHILDSLIKEKKQISEEEFNNILKETEIFNIDSFKDIFKRVGYDDMSANVLKNMMSQEFKKGGDNAASKFIEKVLGVKIYPISRGKYTFREPTK
jgi:predicted nucleic acid-binding OB-fold protein